MNTTEQEITELIKKGESLTVSDGLLLCRRLKLEGTPEAVPFYPHEFIQRQSSMGLVDPSAMVLEDISMEKLDPLQRQRLRNAIKKYGGEQTLLVLADQELDGALGLCREVNGIKHPTVTGLLLLGTENLLVADPRSRNPLLADVIKRIGLAERTGRGIDRIYEGMLRYGRPAPDYTMSDEFTVSVQMVNAAADLDFLKMVVEKEDKLGNMPIDSLIILSRLREERRLTTLDLMPSVQKPEANVRATLEKLVETGFLEPHGTGRGRNYTLSVKLYQNAGKKSEYIRQTGFSSIQQEQMVLNYIDKHGRIKRADVMDLCQITPDQAYKLLLRLKKRGDIVQIGNRKGAVYERKR